MSTLTIHGHPRVETSLETAVLAAVSVLWTQRTLAPKETLVFFRFQQAPLVETLSNETRNIEINSSLERAAHFKLIINGNTSTCSMILIENTD